MSSLLPAAVLWDMDGTLVDTEPSWMAAEYALVAEHGGSWSEEQARALVGNALPTSAEFLRRDGGVDLPLEVIVEQLTDRVVADVRRTVPWRPGARELLRSRCARRGCPAPWSRCPTPRSRTPSCRPWSPGRSRPS